MLKHNESTPELREMEAKADFIKSKRIKLTAQMDELDEYEEAVKQEYASMIRNDRPWIVRFQVSDSYSGR